RGERLAGGGVGGSPLSTGSGPLHRGSPFTWSGPFHTWSPPQGRVLSTGPVPRPWNDRCPPGRAPLPGTRRGTAVGGAGTLGGSGSPAWRVSGPLPPFLGGPLPGYAAALSGLSDAELRRLLERRPDLLSSPAPGSFPELAGRAGTPASLATALRPPDLGALRLAELVAVAGLPTTVAALAEAAGPGLDRERLEAGLTTLAALGIALPGPDGTISGPPGLGAPFARRGGSS